METYNLYCQNLIAKQGTPVYYSLLTVTDKQRQAIIAVRAFAREVSDIIIECEEPAVAYAKFAWWQGELQQLASTTPTHPVTLALQIALHNFNIPFELFQEFMTGIGNDLEKDAYETLSDLFHYHHHTAGAIERIIAHILGFSDEKTLIAVDNFGVYVQMIRHLQNLRILLRRQRSYIPVAELMHYSLKIQDLQQFTMKKPIRDLILQYANQVNHYYQLAVENLPRCDRNSQLSTIKMVEIYRELLNQLVTEDSDILQHYISLTPLRQLWISWRVRRQ